jgi:hypothetical protein
MKFRVLFVHKIASLTCETCNLTEKKQLAKNGIQKVVYLITEPEFRTLSDHEEFAIFDRKSSATQYTTFDTYNYYLLLFF